LAFRYSITFTSHGVDEDQLRSAIEALGVTGAAIVRAPLELSAEARAAGPRPSPIQETVLTVLSDNLPHRKFEITDALAGKVSPTAVTKSIEALVTSGLVRKFKHGIYGSASCSEQAALALPPRMNKTTAESTFGQVMRMIREHPATAVQVREKFGFSRQRAEQILSRAEERGLVQRVSTGDGERGQFIYLSSDAALTDIMDRTPTFVESRRKLLSAMAPGKLYYATDLANFLDFPTGATMVKSWLVGLSKWGLVYTFSIGVKMFCGITPAGVSHKDYDAAMAKAAASDFIGELGVIKAKFLQAVRLLGGTVKTIEITYALGEEIFNGVGYSSGQVMQRLEISELVRRLPRKGSEQPRYSLTKTGEYVSSIVDQFLPPTSVDHLKASVRQRVAQKAELFRRPSDYRIPPTYRAILDVLVEFGAISTQHIPEKMKVQFANPKSINLALKTMEDRGLVKRVGRNKRLGIVWAATDLGKSALSDDAA
jgi:predicted transcriptional regulator